MTSCQFSIQVYPARVSMPERLDRPFFFSQHPQRLCSRSMTRRPVGGWDRCMDISLRRRHIESAISIMRGFNGRAWLTVLCFIRRAVKVVDTGGVEIIDRAPRLHIRVPRVTRKKYRPYRPFQEKGSIFRQTISHRVIKQKKMYEERENWNVNCNT